MINPEWGRELLTDWLLSELSRRRKEGMEDISPARRALEDEEFENKWGEAEKVKISL